MNNINWKMVRGAKINSNPVLHSKTDFKLIHKRILAIVQYELEKSLSQEKWYYSEDSPPPGFGGLPFPSDNVAKWTII